MKKLLLALALIAPGATAWSAISYARFSHPKGDYVLEYPADWKKSFGLQTVSLRPPGRDGKKAKVSMELYPLGKKSPATPEAFEKSVLAAVGKLKKLDSQATVDAAGQKARRLALTETVALKGQYGQQLAGPLKEVYVILPMKDSAYYVLKLEGIGEPFAKALPEFDRMTQKLTLRASPAKP